MGESYIIFFYGGGLTQIELPELLGSRHFACAAMKYSRLAVVVTLLLKEFGEVSEDTATCFQEDCAGDAQLSLGVQAYNLPVVYRDAAWLPQDMHSCP